MRLQTTTRFHYIIFNKPFGVLSQFSPMEGFRTLGDFGPFPGDVYPVGRLDAESEGLLLLTNDNELRHRLTEPRFAHPRTYLVQIERIPSEDALGRLRSGVLIKGKRTRPAQVSALAAEPDLPPRPIPIRFRKSVPTSWLEITLTEGRNRQIRKMTAAVGHPTLRIVRVQIGTVSLRDLEPGDHRSLSGREVDDLRQGLKASLGRPAREDKKRPRRAP